MPDDRLSAYRRNNSRLSILTLSLQYMVQLLVERGLRTGSLDDDSIAQLRAEAIDSLKNTETIGLAIEDEAKVFRQALDDLEQLLDDAISKARQGRAE